MMTIPMKNKISILATAAMLAVPALAAVHENPLLKPSPLPLHYPQFDKIRDSDFGPAFDKGIAEQRREVEAIASSKAAPTFDNTVLALEKSGQTLHRAGLVFFNLLGADSNPARQKVAADYAEKLAAHNDAINTNARVFARVDALFEKREQLGLDAESLHLLERWHRDMLRAGVKLSAAQKKRMVAINGELARLETEFTKRVLAEVDASAIVVDSREELDGLTDEQIAAAAHAAEEHKLPKGKYRIALLNTTDQPMLSQLKNRALRERLFKASIARGSRGNAEDTTPQVARVLALRAEKASLLGYATFSDYSLAEETAKNVPAVNRILDQVSRPAVAAARREGEALQARIDATEKPAFKLEAWDWQYEAEKLRAEKYGFDESQLKPYLELKNVMENGVFYAANQLYGISFKQRTDLPVYQKDVLTYDVFDRDGKQLGIFIADMYARPSKNGGAWMNNYVDQSHVFGDMPVVANHLNIPKPAAGQPTLLTWDEVTTAFHEFGHALHGFFSDVKYQTFSGANTPRDFVEYPSQVNEMWASWPQVLQHYAKHWQTGAPMPQEMVDKVIAAKKFNQGFTTVSYISAAVLDQRWHQLPLGQQPKAAEVMAGEARLLKDSGFDYAPVPPRYRTPYFSHFMGEYASGYYAYLWAEVLDSNTVEWFKANGGLKRENGDVFRAKLLSRGGTEDALGLFRSVVGHEPEIGPLLDRRGMALEPVTAASK
ncbi:M3 family metallopeptidase [Pelomonas sp. KK5]|uniref:M3 family metallopeptidase n=1 Tax=Pelomonas sp. KK5 TaxID=1855730 RepID=UPI001E51D826|nr:M3 family metallopeptidase [Pelomonas sp. KK5]